MFDMRPENLWDAVSRSTRGTAPSLYVMFVPEQADQDLPETNLQPRQIPAVIDSSKFLRRAAHACEFTRPHLFQTEAQILYVAVVAGNKLYIDGGQFSFLSNGNPNYFYCMKR